MGFGCNAAGVVATRIIDSPRERLIAILTNNFALCNGRWPTQFLIATVFIGSLVPAHLAGLISAAAVTGIALLGVLMTFVVSWALPRTLLRGEVSTFSLELPPYRPPRLLRTLYTSLLDRTLFVLWRAVVFAVPAGAAIWLSANVRIGGVSVAEHLVRLLDPPGLLLGLNGVILLAYVVAHGQRDRRPDRPDADGAGHRPARAGAGRRRDVRDRIRGDAEVAARGRRLDGADGRESHALQPASQSLQHHDQHHLQEDRQRQVDPARHRAAAGPRRRGHAAGGDGLAHRRLSRPPAGAAVRRVRYWASAQCTSCISRFTRGEIATRITPAISA
jgi:hypothetical protein